MSEHDQSSNDNLPHVAQEAPSSSVASNASTRRFGSLIPKWPGLLSKSPPAANTRRKNKEANSADVQSDCINEGEPDNYEDAIKSTDSKHWIDAMDREIQSQLQNNTWVLCKLPYGREAIICRWVYKHKMASDGSTTHEARLVARGFNQRQGIDYNLTYSPVVSMDSVRLLLSIATKSNLEMIHFEVCTAFLYGELTEDLCMRQLDGYIKDDKLVCKLQRAVYGLKQASRCWYTTFVSFLQKFDLKPCGKDNCVFIHKNNNNYLIVALYVDDGLVCGNSREIIMQIVDHLKTKFKITISNPSKFVGMEIKRDKTNSSIHVSQPIYIKKMAAKFNLSEANKLLTPMIANQKIYNLGINNQSESPFTQTPHREAIGSINYTQTISRPDVAYAFRVLSSFQCNPRDCHWHAVKRLIVYLNSTPNLGLCHSKTNDNIEDELIAYVD